jgi:DNA-directed RNA polymerase specialized sigma24 family protein
MTYTGKTKNDIINCLAYDKKFIAEMKIFIGNLPAIQELMQDIYVILLESDEEKIIYLNEKDELKFYLVAIIKNQFKNPNGDFYKKNRIKNINIEDLSWTLHEENNEIESEIQKETTIKHNKVINSIENLDWYSKKIAKMYFVEGKSFRTISKELVNEKLPKEFKISTFSLFNTIQKVKQTIKEQM